MNRQASRRTPARYAAPISRSPPLVEARFPVERVHGAPTDQFPRIGAQSPLQSESLSHATPFLNSPATPATYRLVMLPTPRLFRSRWAALIWAGGIIWTAMEFADSQASGHGDRVAVDAAGEAVDANDLAAIANATGL